MRFQPGPRLKTLLTLSFLATLSLVGLAAVIGVEEQRDTARMARVMVDGRTDGVDRAASGLDRVADARALLELVVQAIFGVGAEEVVVAVDLDVRASAATWFAPSLAPESVVATVVVDSPQAAITNSRLASRISSTATSRSCSCRWSSFIVPPSGDRHGYRSPGGDASLIRR